MLLSKESSHVTMTSSEELSLGESVLLAVGDGGHLDIVDWASAKGCLP
jgi:hypothetical protein